MNLEQREFVDPSRPPLLRCFVGEEENGREPNYNFNTSVFHLTRQLSRFRGRKLTFAALYVALRNKVSEHVTDRKRAALILQRKNVSPKKTSRRFSLKLSKFPRVDHVDLYRVPNDHTNVTYHFHVLAPSELISSLPVRKHYHRWFYTVRTTIGTDDTSTEMISIRSVSSNDLLLLYCYYYCYYCQNGRGKWVDDN